MRILMGLVIAALIVAACGSKENSDSGRSVIVSGKVGFPKEGQITIKGWADTTQNVQVLDFDRANYTFRGTVKFTEPGIYRINFFDVQFVDVILDKANLEINVDGNSQNSFSEVIGSPDVKMFKEAQNIRERFNKSPEMAKLTSEFNNAASVNDLETVEALRARARDMMRASNDSIANLLIQNAPSIGVIEFLKKRELDPDQYFSTYEAVAEKFKGEWANYAIAKEFLSSVAKMKLLVIGQEAPEIELPNPEGKLVKLSSLRGKYVLVDFWAKWCGPCRRENPNVVAAYKKFKDKGFEVFGVSLDKNKADWVQAIEQDGLTWTHVSDLKYFDSDAARLYNISYIPFSVLLDKNGVIIAKNLREGALHKKLEEIFGN